MGRKSRVSHQNESPDVLWALWNVDVRLRDQRGQYDRFHPKYYAVETLPLISTIPHFYAYLQIDQSCSNTLMPRTNRHISSAFIGRFFSETTTRRA
jgi:hypothetical protein